MKIEHGNESRSSLGRIAAPLSCLFARAALSCPRPRRQTRAAEEAVAISMTASTISVYSSWC
jgi:hypothetical protein